MLFAAAPAFGATAITVEDKSIEGKLIGLDATPAVTLSVRGKPQRIPCADLVAIQLREGKAARRAGYATIVLRGGGSLRGAIQGGSGRAIVLQSAVFGSLECPLQAIARIELPVDQPAKPLEPAEKLDRLLLRNGESVEGTVESLGAKGIRFRSDLLGGLEVGFDRITALTLAREGGATPPKPKGVVAIVHADDGTVVAGRVRGLADGRLGLQALFGATLSLDVARVLRVEFRGGRLVYLSDAEPTAVKETPFFDLAWRYRRDRSVEGNPLRMGERTYAKGLGVHSRCELTYALDGAYRRFLADVGIDEEVGDKGNVDVTVLVDGKARFERKGVTGRDKPIPVAVDVAGAKRLTLIVDFGRELDICDHLDWANARLVR